MVWVRWPYLAVEDTLEKLTSRLPVRNKDDIALQCGKRVLFVFVCGGARGSGGQA